MRCRTGLSSSADGGDAVDAVDERGGLDDLDDGRALLLQSLSLDRALVNSLDAIVFIVLYRAR